MTKNLQRRSLLTKQSMLDHLAILFRGIIHVRTYLDLNLPLASNRLLDLFNSNVSWAVISCCFHDRLKFEGVVLDCLYTENVSGTREGLSRMLVLMPGKPETETVEIHEDVIAACDENSQKTVALFDTSRTKIVKDVSSSD